MDRIPNISPGEILRGIFPPWEYRLSAGQGNPDPGDPDRGNPPRPAKDHRRYRPAAGKILRELPRISGWASRTSTICGKNGSGWRKNLKSIGSVA